MNTGEAYQPPTEAKKKIVVTSNDPELDFSSIYFTNQDCNAESLNLSILTVRRIDCTAISKIKENQMPLFTGMMFETGTTRGMADELIQAGFKRYSYLRKQTNKGKATQCRLFCEARITAAGQPVELSPDDFKVLNLIDTLCKPVQAEERKNGAKYGFNLRDLISLYGCKERYSLKAPIAQMVRERIAFLSSCTLEMRILKKGDGLENLTEIEQEFFEPEPDSRDITNFESRRVLPIVAIRGTKQHKGNPLYTLSGVPVFYELAEERGRFFNIPVEFYKDAFGLAKSQLPEVRQGNYLDQYKINQRVFGNRNRLGYHRTKNPSDYLEKNEVITLQDRANRKQRATANKWVSGYLDILQEAGWIRSYNRIKPTDEKIVIQPQKTAEAQKQADAQRRKTNKKDKRVN